MKQDRGIGGCDDRDLIKHFLEGWAPSDDIFEAVLRANFCFHMQLPVCEIADVGKTRSGGAPEVGESNSRAHSLLPYLYTSTALRTAKLISSSVGKTR
jgi:hypothetical protein